MKFQKSTLILLMSALFLAGIVYTWEREGRPQIEARKLKENQIFGLEEKNIQSVILTTKNYSLQFDRNGKFGTNLTQPKWLLKVLQETPKSDRSKDTATTPSPTAKATESPKAKDTAVTPSPTAKATETVPKQIAANEPYVSYLLNLVAQGKAERIQIDPRQADGLDNPLATIEIKLINGQTDKLILGNSNFNNTFLYALANPPQQVKQPLDILLVSTDFRNAVDRPLSEWKQEEVQKPNSGGTNNETSKNTNSENKKEPDKNTDKSSTGNPKKDDRTNSDRQPSEKAKAPDNKPKTAAPENPKR